MKKLLICIAFVLGCQQSPEDTSCRAPGYYTCEDACAFAHAGLCSDLAQLCGMNCGQGRGTPDWNVEDPCPTPAHLVVTPHAPLDGWTTLGADICNEGLQTYCADEP